MLTPSCLASPRVFLRLPDQVIAKDTVVANEKKAVVQKEEEVCNAQAAQASSLKQSCEHDLAEAIPILEQAIKALSALDKASIVEVRGKRKRDVDRDR